LTEGLEIDSALNERAEKPAGSSAYGVGVTVGVVAAPGAGGVWVILTLCAGVGVLIPNRLLSLEQPVTVVDKSKAATRIKTWIFFIFSSRVNFHGTRDNITLASASAMKSKSNKNIYQLSLSDDMSEANFSYWGLRNA